MQPPLLGVLRASLLSTTTRDQQGAACPQERTLPSHLAQAISNERWVLKTLGNHLLCGTTQHTVTQVGKLSLRKKMCDPAQNLLFVTRSEFPGQNPRGHLQPSGKGFFEEGAEASGVGAWLLRAEEIITCQSARGEAGICFSDANANEMQMKWKIT